MDKWYPNQKIGDIFLKMAAFMKVYTEYVRNFNDALSQIQVVISEYFIFYFISHIAHLLY